MPDVSPGADRTLSFMSFAALWWVVVNQFRVHLGLDLGARSGLVAKGYLGADLFLIILGFVLCRAWLGRTEARPVGHGSLVWRRIAPNYPLHLLAMAAIAAMAFAGQRLGVGFSNHPVTLSALPANILLIHAWGVLPTVYWNFPSWILSAEFAGCLLFPALMLLARRPATAALALVLGSVLLFEVMFAVAAARGVLFTDMTARIGALRVFPDFLLGAGLYRLSGVLRLSRPWAMGLAGAALLWILAAASLRWSDTVIWPAFGALALGLAEAGRDDGPALDSPPLLYLGRIAYAVYLVYLPVDIAYSKGLRLLIGQPTGALAWTALIGVFATILAVGALAYHIVQKPIGSWLTRRDPFARPWQGPRSAGR